MLRRQLALLASGASLLVCTACESSSLAGTPSAPSTSSAPTTTTPALSADEVQSSVKTAIQGASAVHIKGSLNDAGDSITLDLQLNKDSASGTISKQGATMPVLLVNGLYYVQVTDDVLKMTGHAPNSPAMQLVRNKWLPSTSQAGAKMTSAFKTILSYDSFMHNIVDQKPDKPGEWIPTGPDTIDSVAVLSFKDTTDGSIVDVAATSPHYLIRGVSSGSSPATLDFTGWNEPVPVTAPPTSQILVQPGINI